MAELMLKAQMAAIVSFFHSNLTPIIQLFINIHLPHNCRNFYSDDKNKKSLLFFLVAFPHGALDS